MRPLILLLLFFSFASYAAPKSELWPYWQTSDEQSTLEVSHQTWQNLLDRYLVRQGKIPCFAMLPFLMRIKSPQAIFS